MKFDQNDAEKSEGLNVLGLSGMIFWIFSAVRTINVEEKLLQWSYELRKVYHPTTQNQKYRKELRFEVYEKQMYKFQSPLLRMSIQVQPDQR